MSTATVAKTSGDKLYKSKDLETTFSSPQLKLIEKAEPFPEIILTKEASPTSNSEIIERSTSNPSSISTLEAKHALIIGNNNSGATSKSLKVEDYKINPIELTNTECELGKGNFGIVYGGLYQEKPVAIKKLFEPRKTKKHPDPKLKLETMLKRELDIQVHLETRLASNLVQFYGYYQFENSYYIISELMIIGTLTNYIKKQAQPSPTLQLKMMMGTLRGLKYIHDKNVIHHDIKADNILFNDELTPKLCDFGLSRRKVPGKKIGSLGTPLWSAPEKLYRLPCDEKVDIYSYALVAWCILAWKESPYQGEINIYKFREKILNGMREPIPQHYPELLKNSITAAWNNSSDARPIASQLLKDVELSMIEIESQRPKI